MFARCATVLLALLPLATHAEAWDALFSAEVKRVGTAGAAAAVLDVSGTHWIGVQGLANSETGVAVTSTTLFQMGSVTKNFTATLIGAMVQDGRLGWEDPLSRHLSPDALDATSPLATLPLHRLATHTAGLPKDPPNRVDVDGVMRAYARDELKTALRATQPDDAPWNYSNYGYAVLGFVAERAAGRPYESLLRARLLEPLGMRDTWIDVPPKDEARIAVHYWPEDDPRRPRPRWRFGEVAGFGGLTTTIDDLARWLQFQLFLTSEAPVSRDTLLAMRLPSALFPDWRLGFSPGWFIERASDGTLLYFHPGEVDGHSAYLGIAPMSGAGVAVLANLGQSAAPDIGRVLLEHAARQARSARQWSADETMQAWQSGQYADAEAGLGQLVARHPDDGANQRRLGIARFELRDLDGAAVALKAAAGTGEVMAHVLLARIAALRGAREEAVSALTRAHCGGVPPSEWTGFRELRDLRSDSRLKAIEQGCQVCASAPRPDPCRRGPAA